MRHSTPDRIVTALLLTAAASSARAQEPSLAAARALEAAFSRGEEAAFVAAFDTEAFYERALPGAAETQAFEQAAQVGQRLAANVTTAVEAGASYRLLRIRVVDGAERAVFRLLRPEGSFNYHELLLASRDGAVRVEDVYVATAGEWMSQSVGRAMQLARATLDPGLVARLTGADRELVESAALMRDYSSLLTARRFPEARAVYDKLPASVQGSKSILLGAIAAAGSDEEAYMRTVERFERLFPDDPALDVVLIDYYYARKSYPDALERLQSLSRYLDGDAYLQTLAATMQTLMGDPVAARRSLEAAIAMEPGLPDPYWALVELQLGERDWAGTVATLRAIERDAGVRLGDLTGGAVYAEFLKTDEYREWMEARRR
jgi:tetratricopeptide (TPR) repeat protein